ncbi:MAG: hypothetical protein QM730_07225 [Anaerolineales bacterium]
MSIEPALEQNEVQKQPVSLPFSSSIAGRIVYGLFLTIIPAFSFLAVHLLEPEWQNGKLSSYVILSLFPEASILFVLLLIYSIVSYIFFLVKPYQYSHSIIVRIGIYTGILLALQFSIAMLLFSTDGFIFILILAWALPILVSLIYRWSKGKWAIWKINITIAAILFAILIPLSIYESNATLIPMAVLAGLLVAAPFGPF